MFIRPKIEESFKSANDAEMIGKLAVQEVLLKGQTPENKRQHQFISRLSRHHRLGFRRDKHNLYTLSFQGFERKETASVGEHDVVVFDICQVVFGAPTF